jgi:hypothetical protein
MQRELWPEGSLAEHEHEIENFFSGESREPLAVLIADDEGGSRFDLPRKGARPAQSPTWRDGSSRRTPDVRVSGAS